MTKGKSEWAKAVDERHQRMIAGEVTPAHGTYSTYSNYRCRCERCRAAAERETATRRFERRRREGRL